MSLPKQQLQQTQSQKPVVDLAQICKWISELPNPNTRENAMAELGRNRDLVQKFAPIFWHSFGVTATLLQEVVNVYWSLTSFITPYQLTRVSNALALLQCVASHPETRQKFIEADIPVYLYPFLKTTCKSKTFEYLRLTTLGVIGALVKTDEQYVITFLLQSEVTPLCLRIMENGSELSKTVATFIMQKILLNDNGLEYVCETHDRFSQVAMILGKIVLTLVEEPSVRLLKHVIRCYSRLSDNFRAREALQQCLPDQLRDNTFMPFLAEDPQTQNILFTLQRNIDTPVVNPLFVIMQNNVTNYPF